MTATCSRLPRDRWRLNKDVSFSLEFLRDASPKTNLGCRLALTRYAEEMSAAHTRNLRERFAQFIRETKASAVTSEALINWRSQLDSANEWKLGACAAERFWAPSDTIGSGNE